MLWVESWFFKSRFYLLIPVCIGFCRESNHYIIVETSASGPSIASVTDDLPVTERLIIWNKYKIPAPSVFAPLIYITPERT